MASTAGAGRIVRGTVRPGPGADRVERSNLTEFRGSLWEAVNDWFFGYNSVDLDWNSTADAGRFFKWLLTADSDIATTIVADPDVNMADVTATSSDIGLKLPGASGDYWDTPDTASLDLTGDLYMAVDLRAIDWTAAATQTVLAKFEPTGNQRSFALDILSTGVWRWYWSTDGINSIVKNCAVAIPFADGQPGALRIIHDADNGTGTTEVRFYTATSIAIGDWTLRDTQTNAGVSTFFNSTAPLRIGARDAGTLNMLAGTVHNVVIANNTTGASPVLNIAGGDLTDGASTFTDNGGRTWTKHGAASIKNPRYLSNLREVFVVPETATWGIAHIITEISPTVPVAKGTQHFGGDSNIKPQHGIALRAQEDTGRRAIIAWHDIAFSNPSVINLGVWQDDLTGTNFYNRQGNVAMNLGVTYNITSGVRSSGITTITMTGGIQDLIPGDRINPYGSMNTNWTRASNIVTHTFAGHPFDVGNKIQVIFSGSADGTFVITGVNTGAGTFSYPQTGINESGTALLFNRSFDHETRVITSVNAAAGTVTYPDPGPDTTLAAGTAYRQFPYFMEARCSGTVAQVRCWDRTQAVPDWLSPTNALVIDLDNFDQTFTVTAASRTSNVVTLTLTAEHKMPIGGRIDTDLLDASYDGTNFVVTAIPAANQVQYTQVAADAGTSTGTMRRVGAGTETNVITAPTPRGSGRIGFDSAHLGYDTSVTRVRYGGTFGDNDPDSSIVALTTGDPELPLSGEIDTTFPMVTGVAQALDGASGAVAEHTGSLSVAVALAGTSNAVAEHTAPLNVAMSLAGSSDAVAEHTGLLGLALPLAGSVDAVAGHTGAATIAWALGGTSQAVGEHTGALTAAWALAGSSDAVGEHTGLLGLALPLAGSGDAVAEHTGSLTFAVAIAGSSDAVAEHTGTMAVERGLDGTSQAVGEHTGALTAAWALAGSSDAVGEHTGALTAAWVLAGTSQAVGEHTGDLTIQGQVVLAGSIDAVAEHTGALSVTWALAGTGQSVGEHSGLLGLAQPLTGTSQSVAEHAGALGLILTVAGSSDAAAEHTGLLAIDRGLAGSSDAVADLTGTVNLALGLAGVSTAVGEHTGSLSLALVLAGIAQAVAGHTGDLSISVILLSGRPTLVAVTDNRGLVAVDSRTRLDAVPVRLTLKSED